jgi:hypothetical protein
LRVAKTWDGRDLPALEQVEIQLSWEGEDLLIQVDAPGFGDPAPEGRPGPTWALWEHEVVEVFLLGED